MDRETYRRYLLSGTVSFPATFPCLAQLEFREISPLPRVGPQAAENRAVLLVASERPAPRVRLSRSVAVGDVRAVFIPRDPRHVDLEDGRWLLDSEVESGLQHELFHCGKVLGIVFVPEAARSLLEVEAGMTAGESVQYYPPLPRDPSYNHYDAGKPSCTSTSYFPCELYNASAQVWAMDCPSGSPRNPADSHSQGSYDDPFLTSHPCE